MVCALAFGLRGPGSSPDQGHCVVFFGRHITLTVPLSNQVYKWVPTDLMLGTTLRWTTDTGARRRPDGSLGSYTDFILLCLLSF